ncbi:MAG: PX domain-containing protein ypt35 [Chaenotheca gracillima]|nr:MAG: PX domain-containing protein ypt35 [Chaenotheca gracillima]
MHSLAVLMVAVASSCLVSGQAIAPDSVPLSTRQLWCTDQKTSCPLLCSQLPGKSTNTKANTCDAATLIYSCICTNGQSPNSSEYSQTIPYFECTEANNQCVNNCGTDSACASNCRQNNLCGAQNPKRVNLTTSTASSTVAATATSSGSNAIDTAGFGGQGSSSGTKDNGAVGALDLGRAYGLAVVVVGTFAGFAILL